MRARRIADVDLVLTREPFGGSLGAAAAAGSWWNAARNAGVEKIQIVERRRGVAKKKKKKLRLTSWEAIRDKRLIDERTAAAYERLMEAERSLSSRMRQRDREFSVRPPRCWAC
jgi:hypothetical protein